MENLKGYIEYVATSIEIIGVFTIVVCLVFALVRFLFERQGVKPRSFKKLRQELGNGILLGLEILVAGDIVATVVTEPTLDNVLILGIIVLIRTFLSFSLDVELEGKFPWQKGGK